MKINTKLILDFIKLNNLNVEEFCKMCAINLNTYKNIVENKFSPAVRTVYKIKRVLNLDFAQLIKK